MPAAAAALTVLALALASAALAGNGGLAPPDAESPNAEGINQTYYFILAFTGVIFVLVEGLLLLFVFRFRRGRRSREAEGPQIRGNTRLELIWTLLPVLILVAIGGFVFYKLPGIQNVPSANAQGGRLDVTVEGHRYYWEYRYPNGVVAVDRMRAPVGQNVQLTLVAPVDDVIHSWWIPALGGKLDTIPGQTNRTWFRARRSGTFVGQCAEFCGIQHAAMLAAVEVMPREEFEQWLASEERAQRTGSSMLGADTWAGACAKCHGQNAQGGIGPTLVGNGAFRDREALEAIVRQGQGEMPPIGQTWDDRQVDALYRYVRREFGSGGGTGGG